MTDMGNKLQISKIKKTSLFVLIAVTALYSLAIISTYHFERFSADSTLYLNIAEKYIAGDFENSINGYWGPMLSWLLIPFLLAGTSHVFAVNALYLLAGIFTMSGVWILSYRFDISENIRIATLVALLPIMLFISTVELFDLLLLCFIIFYLGIIFRNNYHERLLNGALCGLLCAFAYFSKSYALPFFIVHFTIMNIAHFIRCESKADRSQVIRNAVTGLLVFVIVISPWVYLLSSKYEHFTFSNMGKGNFAAHAPGLPQSGLEVGGPMFHKGFFAPPNETAVSAWEDPSFIWEDIESWSPLDSAVHFKHFIKNTVNNLFECLRIYQSFSRLSVTILLIYLLLLIANIISKDILRGDMLYVFFTLILYTGGYVPFHFETRYLWLVNILLLLMGGYVTTMLLKTDFFKNNLRKSILIIIFTASFILTPLKSYMQAGNESINKEMYELSRELKEEFNIKQGNIASNREWVHEAIHDSWHNTFRLSYWLQSRYYGQAKKNISETELLKELKDFGIDYYFYWGELDEDTPVFLSKYREITEGKIPGLRVFSFKEPRS